MYHGTRYWGQMMACRYRLGYSVGSIELHDCTVMCSPVAVTQDRKLDMGHPEPGLASYSNVSLMVDCYTFPLTLVLMYVTSRQLVRSHRIYLSFLQYLYNNSTNAIIVAMVVYACVSPGPAHLLYSTVPLLLVRRGCLVQRSETSLRLSL